MIKNNQPSLEDFQSNKRFRFKKENGQWKCEDKFTPYMGYGSTPKSAFADWAIEIEMDTSDLHK